MFGLETLLAAEKFYQLLKISYDAVLYTWSFAYTPKKKVKFYKPPPIPRELPSDMYDREWARFLMALALNVSSSLYLGENYPTVEGVKGVIFGKPRPCGMIFELDTATLLIFSNTKFFEEWVRDAQAMQIIPEEIRNFRPIDKVHKGFYEIYKGCKFDPQPSFEKPLIIAGHSLGGALSTLASVDLCKTRKSVVAYSFGSPRSLSIIASDTFNELIKNPGITLFRVFNTEDIVPTLPLPNMPKQNFYQHVGENVCFTDSEGDISSDHVDAYVNFYDIETLS